MLLPYEARSDPISALSHNVGEGQSESAASSSKDPDAVAPDRSSRRRTPLGALLAAVNPSNVWGGALGRHQPTRLSTWLSRGSCDEPSPDFVPSLAHETFGDDLEGSRKPSKEYRVRVWVRLTDDMLPQPLMSRSELEAHLNDALGTADPESVILSIAVDDPRTTTNRRY